MLLYVPKTIWYAGPIAFLFSITYILSDLYANNEMTAIFASGISLYRFVAPLIIISVIFSFGLFYLEDKLVVSTLEQKNDLQETLLGTKEDADNSNIIVLSDNGKITYKANRYDDSKRQLRTLYCIFRTEEKKLDSIIYSDSSDFASNTELCDLEEAEKRYVEHLVSTIDLDNEIIVKTYGKNLVYANNEISQSLNDTSLESSKSILDYIVSIVEEYIHDCTLLFSKTKTLFKKEVTINSIKKKYVDVSNGLDKVVVELKKEKRVLSNNISVLERRIRRIFQFDKELTCYIMAGMMVIKSSTQREFDLDKNIIEFKSRIEDLKNKRFLLSTELASLTIALESAYIVYRKIEHILENVIPKWRLHMALILQIQYVNDLAINRSVDIDELLEDLRQIKSLDKKDINNDALIVALINANNIINQ